MDKTKWLKLTNKPIMHLMTDIKDIPVNIYFLFSDQIISKFLSFELFNKSWLEQILKREYNI